LPKLDCNDSREWEGKVFPCIAEHQGEWTYTGCKDFGHCKFGAEYEALVEKHGLYGRYDLCPKTHGCRQDFGHRGECDKPDASGGHFRITY
jgi:hypothetical protein